MHQVISYFQLFIYEGLNVQLSFFALLYGGNYSFYAEYMNNNNLLCDMLIIIVLANFLYETIYC